MITVYDSPRNCTFELAVQYLAYTFGYVSFFLLVSIAFDRYLHITKLNKYNLFMTKFRMRSIMLTIFFSSNGAALVTIFLHSFYYQLVLIVINSTGMGGIYIMYARVLSKLRKHNKSMENSKASSLGEAEKIQQTQDLTENKSKRVKRELRVGKTVKLLLAAMMVFLIPYNAVSLAFTYYRFSQGTNPPLVVNVAGYLSIVFLFSIELQMPLYSCTAIGISNILYTLHLLANREYAEWQRLSPSKNQVSAKGINS